MGSIIIVLLNPHAHLGRAPKIMKIILRIQGAKGLRIQVKGMEVKTLEPSNPIFVLNHPLFPRDSRYPLIHFRLLK